MAKFKVVISDYYYENLDSEKEEIGKLDAIMEDYHCKTEQEVIAVAHDADALIVQFAPITRKVIENLERCKLIVRYAIGVDNIDIEAAAEHGIYVANVPDYSIDEVSNHAIALLFACARKLTIANASVHRGEWSYLTTAPLYRLSGQRLGLIGLGRIPSLVARKMSNFGLDIVAFDPYQSEEYAKSIGVRLIDLDELLRTSDMVSVHCPLGEQTRHILDGSSFRKMKKTAILVNTARGAVVSEADLAQALKNGEIAMAGLDVCETEPLPQDSPLLSMENVIITPHMGWYSLDAIASLQRKVAQEVVQVLSGNKPLHPVNTPKDPRKTL